MGTVSDHDPAAPDAEPLGRISELADEEHRIRESESEGTATAEDRERLAEVERLLDQCWDLLRQRRARRDAGLDPAQAEVRDPGVIGSYRQ
jgi:hypothetical protein